MSRARIAFSLLLALAALPGTAAASHEALDTTKPVVALDQPSEDSFTYYQQPAQVFFSGTVQDESGDGASHRTRIEIEVFDPEETLVQEHDLGLQPNGGWYLNTSWSGQPALQHGVEYRAIVRATDEAGNTEEVETLFLADGVAPQYTTTEAPTETDDPTPRIAGTATMQPGDMPFVAATATKPSPDGNGEVGVASVQLDIRDGSFAGELSPELPPGDYTLRLTRLDQAMNATLRLQPLKILPAPTPVAPSETQEQQQQPPPPTIVESRILPPDPAATAKALSTAARRALARVRIARLLRRGAAVRFAADQAGVAGVQLLRGRTVVAKGRRSFAAAGAGTIRITATRAGRRALRRARRASLTLRVTFAPAGGATRAVATRLTLRR